MYVTRKSLWTLDPQNQRLLQCYQFFSLPKILSTGQCIFCFKSLFVSKLNMRKIKINRHHQISKMLFPHQIQFCLLVSHELQSVLTATQFLNGLTTKLCLTPGLYVCAWMDRYFKGSKGPICLSAAFSQIPNDPIPRITRYSMESMKTLILICNIHVHLGCLM